MAEIGEQNEDAREQRDGKGTPTDASHQIFDFHPLPDVAHAQGREQEEEGREPRRRADHGVRHDRREFLEIIHVDQVRHQAPHDHPGEVPSIVHLPVGQLEQRHIGLHHRKEEGRKSRVSQPRPRVHFPEEGIGSRRPPTAHEVREVGP